MGRRGAVTNSVCKSLICIYPSAFSNLAFSWSNRIFVDSFHGCFAYSLVLETVVVTKAVSRGWDCVGGSWGLRIDLILDSDHTKMCAHSACGVWMCVYAGRISRVTKSWTKQFPCRTLHSGCCCCDPHGPQEPVQDPFPQQCPR